jgi:hypothetical protein
VNYFSRAEQSTTRSAALDLVGVPLLNCRIVGLVSRCFRWREDERQDDDEQQADGVRDEVESSEEKKNREQLKTPTQSKSTAERCQSQTIDAKIGVFGCAPTIVKFRPQLLKT